MAEVAPNLYVSPHLPKGTAYQIDAGAMFPGHSGMAIAISEHDWERIPEDVRTEAIDRIYRDAANRAARLLLDYAGGG